MVKILKKNNFNLVLILALFLNVFVVSSLPATLENISRGSVTGFPPSTTPYVIITSEDLVANFQSLADRKTREGTYCEIKTVSWIRSNYTGSDTAEAIRNFIKDYYANKGLVWVLLGGNLGKVPTRYVWTILFDGQSNICDNYYSCLDGNWNFDGDTLYGEVGDSVDLKPEVYVGRVPAANSVEVDVFVKKLLDYQRNNPVDQFHKKVLFLGSKMFYNGDSQQLCDSVASRFPGNFIQTKLYQYIGDQPGPENRDTVIKELNTGHGIVVNFSQSQHEQNFLVRYDNPPVGFIREPITNSDADTLKNYQKYSVMFSVVCWNNRWKDDCIAEHFAFNDSGGTIAWIGSVQNDFGFRGGTLAKSFFDSLFVSNYKNVGKLVWAAKRCFDGYTFYEGSWRYLTLSYHLLGDPQMEIWTDMPKFCWQSHLTSLYKGQTYTFNDTIRDPSNQPVVGATVCLKKGTEVYEVKTTNSAGVVTFTVSFPTTGTATILASKTGFITDSSSINIANPPSGGGGSCPFLYVWNGITFEEDNTILTQVEYTAKEQSVTDYYHIQKPLVVKDRQYHLQVREEPNEKSFIDQIELLTVDHPLGQKIVTTADGKIFYTSEEFSPTSALDDKEEEHAEQVRIKDGIFYSSDKAGYLVLTFDLSDKMGRGPMVFGDPNRPCTPSAPGGGGRVSPNLPIDPSFNLIKTEIQDIDGNWIELAQTPPRDNYSQNFRLIDQTQIQLGKTLTIRISWNSGYSADEIKFYSVGEETPIVTTLAPLSVSHSTSGSVTKLVSADDRQFATLVQGEKLDLFFPAEGLPLPEGYTRDFIVKASGYYIPWISEPTATIPDRFELKDNYPNPFNATTEIKFALPQESYVKLAVYNIMGQKVKTLFDGRKTAGVHKVVWDGRNDSGEIVASGVYFYTIRAGTYIETKKMTLLK